MQINVYFVALKIVLMQKAVFFDRDGVINREIGNYVIQIKDFELLPDILECFQLCKENGFLIIIITNQGGIDKALYNEKDLESFHSVILNECKKHDIQIEDIYYCRHHPSVGNCLCRKPEPLMIQKAIAKHNIDKNKSFIIGDNPRDIEAGEKAGIDGILIQPNSAKFRLIKEKIETFNQ